LLVWVGVCVVASVWIRMEMEMVLV
jgi:hypothetical protein